MTRTAPPVPLSDEAAAYCRNPFDRSQVTALSLPLEDEPHLAAWRRYAAEDDVFGGLRARFPQFRVPIRAGCSATDDYARVIRRGQRFEPTLFGGDELTLERPDLLTVAIHAHFAGSLPVLVAGTRGDFETLYRALACRSEPVPVGPSVNAHMIAGIVNWDRVAAVRRAFLEAGGDPAAWRSEMARVAASTPNLFHDRLILMAEAPYAGKSPSELGLTLDDHAWRQTSRQLRLEHEFTHYATKRLYGTMRLNLQDELIADAMAMTAALGRFSAHWFLTALGLGDWPAVSPTGRVHTYCAGLSEAAFQEIVPIVVSAAAHLEQLTGACAGPATRARYLLTLTTQSLPQLAAADAETTWREGWAWAGTVVGER